MKTLKEMPVREAPVREVQRGDEELLYRFEARLDFNVVGRVAEGLQMSNPFEGTATEGIFRGARVWGSDPFLLRADGIGVIDVPKTISGDGYHVLEHVRAYSFPPADLEMPPLEALLAPDFEWPDAPFPILGSSTFRTGAPALAWLNRVVARVDGFANLATGDLVIETRALAPVDPARLTARPAVGDPGTRRDPRKVNTAVHTIR